MSQLALAAGCLLVPLILAATGLVVLRAVRCGRERAWAAPLMGAAVWCLAGMLAIMTRTDPGAWCLALLVIVAGFGAAFRRDFLRAGRELRTYFIVHLFTLGVLCVLPFPGMWLMGGDWMQHYGVATAVWQRGFGLEHLAPSPSFAAGAIVVLPFHPSLAAFQIYVAATTSAAILVLLAGARAPAEFARRRWAIGWVCASAFYLVHLQNLWPKWLASGFFVAAIVEALRHRARGEFAPALLAIFWFGMSVAADASSALLAPFLLVAFGWPALAALARRRLAWAGGLALVLLTFAGWHLWTLAVHGLHARVAQPPVAVWDQGRALPARVALNLADHLAGLLPMDLWRRWAAADGPRASAQVLEDLYYTTVALSSWMSATLLTIFGAALWRLRSEVAAAWRKASRAGAVRAWAIAFTAALALNCLVLPIAPRYGAAQCGFTQVCLLGLLALVVHVFAHAPTVWLRRLLRWNLATGLIPFALLALGVLLALHMPHPGREALAARLAAADRDWWTVRERGLEVLAVNFFPFGILVFALGCAVLWAGALRATGQNIRTRQSAEEM